MNVKNVYVKITNKTSGKVVHRVNKINYYYKDISTQPVETIKASVSETLCGIGFCKTKSRNENSKNILKIRYGNLPFRDLKQENFQMIYSQKKLVSSLEEGSKLCPKCFPLEMVNIHVKEGFPVDLESDER
jgi:hypothetical protein